MKTVLLLPMNWETQLANNKKLTIGFSETKSIPEDIEAAIGYKKLKFSEDLVQTEHSNVQLFSKITCTIITYTESGTGVLQEVEPDSIRYLIERNQLITSEIKNPHIH